MCAKLLILLVSACQIILSGSSVVDPNRYPVPDEIAPTSAAQFVSTLPEGYVKFPENHAAYKVHRISVTWEEARRRCTAENATLAIADTVDKIGNIRSLNFAIFKWLHVGFYQSFNSNEWIRASDGVPVSSLPWRSGSGNGTRHCAGISISANELIDYGCDWVKEFFVCEIRA